MERTISILLFLSVFSITCLAQTTKTNALVVHTDTTAEQNYNEILRHLVLYGYDIESKYDDLLTIRTGQKTAIGGGRELQYTLQISCFDNQIVIRAKIHYFNGMIVDWHWHSTGFMGGNSNGIVYYGEKGIEELLQMYIDAELLTFETL